MSAEADQFLARISGETAARTILYTSLIDALVAAGIWSQLDALWIFAAADETTACVNLKSADFTATPTLSPTFTADRGFAGDGVQSYVDLNFNPTTASSPNFTQNDAHLGVWSLTSAPDDGRLLGWYDGTDGAALQTRTGAGVNAFNVRINNAGAIQLAINSDGRGWYAANRTASNATQAYIHGVQAGTGTAVSTALNNFTFKTHFTQTGGVYSSHQCAAASIGGSLTAAEHANLCDAISGYMFAVGAGGPQGSNNWFTDPRAIVAGDDLVVGTSASNAFAKVVSQKYGTTVKLNTAAFAADDDHSSPAFLIRASDQKIMAWYHFHNANTFFQRVSTNALDARTWDAQVDIAPNWTSLTEMAYGHPIQLTGEANDPIYLFFRGVSPDTDGDRGAFYSTSEDGGSTWSDATYLLSTAGVGTVRPYLKAVRNGNSRIDFAASDGHPGEITDCSLYHFYYEGGDFHESDGTVITDPLPLVPAASLTQIYDGTGVGGEGWQWDIQIAPGGNPVIVYSAGTDVGAANSYRYTRWNGSSWDDSLVVADAGGTITDTAADNPFYAGGIVIDPDDINVVYYSSKVGGVHQIFRAVSMDGGDTWTPTQLNSSAIESFRPYKPAGSDHLLYYQGNFIDYLDFANAYLLSFDVSGLGGGGDAVIGTADWVSGADINLRFLGRPIYGSG